MDKEKLTSIVFYFLLIVAPATPFFVIGLTNTPLDVDVDPEFINGILAGSSILFGFWSIMLTQKEFRKLLIWKSRTGSFITLFVMPWFIFTSVFLVVSVFVVFLCAIGLVPHVFGLSLVLQSFFYNALLILSSLYYILPMAYAPTPKGK